MGPPHATQETLQALLVLQHRGQDAAGILTYDPQQTRFHHHCGHGLIQDAIPAGALKPFAGTISIGHNRYATTATKNDYSLRDLQPQFVNFPDGIALAHNGNLVNAAELKEWLSRECRRHLAGDRRDGDRGRDPREDQERRQQEAATHTEQAGQESHRTPDPHQKEEVHREFGDGKVELQRSWFRERGDVSHPRPRTRPWSEVGRS